MRLKKKKETDLDILEINDEDAGRHLDLLRDILENTQSNIQKALRLLKEKEIDSGELLRSLKATKEASEGFVVSESGEGKIIEGVFNGEKMVGGEGIEYNVPPNYASKSKLVEGDILKLTITANGSFIYKQIGPVERKQIIATLAQDENSGDWYAVKGKTQWKLLTASVTYFHGLPGDDVVILIPADGATRWAAVENVIRTVR